MRRTQSAAGPLGRWSATGWSGMSCGGVHSRPPSETPDATSRFGTKRRRENGSAFQSVVQIRDQPIRFRLRDVSGGEVRHEPVNDGDQVASEDDLVRRTRDPLRRRFQRRPSCVVRSRVVTEQRKGGHVASRRKPVGHGHDPPLSTVHRDPVNVRFPRRLKRRLLGEFRHRLVRRAVG